MSEINGLRQPEKYFGCYLLKPRIVLKWDTNWEDSMLHFSKQGIGLQKYSFKYDLIDTIQCQCQFMFMMAAPRQLLLLIVALHLESMRTRYLLHAPETFSRRLADAVQAG